MSGQPDTEDQTPDRTPGQAPDPMLSNRYGASSRTRRGAVLVGSILVAAVFLGWLTWATLGNSDTQVTSQLATFNVDDPHVATASLQVHLGNDGTEASCTLQALAYDHSVVGELVVHPVATAGDRDYAVRIKTDRKATTVESVGCTTSSQNRPG